MNSEENPDFVCMNIGRSSRSIAANCNFCRLSKKEFRDRKRLKSYYESKSVDEFFKLLQRNENILFGRESDEDTSLFEDILRTNNHDHAEFIRNIWIEFKLWNNENILTTYNSYMKLPIDYIIESGNILNLICFFVFDFNTPEEVESKDDNKYSIEISHQYYLQTGTFFNTREEVESKDDNKYFLILKSQQYFLKTGQTIFKKLYSIIEEEEMYQEICIQIMEEILTAKHALIQDIETETSIEYVLKMKNLQYSTEILKLLVFYWDIDENPNQFNKYKKILVQKSPFCELILNLKEGTEHNFQELFYRYIEEMKIQFKGIPNLHKIILQNDKKYLMNHKIFAIKYRSYANNYYINNEIPDDSKLLDLHDDVIFTILSKKQKILHDQMRILSRKKELNEILKITNYQEVILILFARSQTEPENILEQLLRKPDNTVNGLLYKMSCKYEMETFYTEKMLLMRNPLGKQLMDYVIESKDDKNIINFLYSDFACKFAIKESLFVLINEQLKQKKNKTIFQAIYGITPYKTEMKSYFMLFLERLLYEMIEIDDIEFECDIETVLAMKPMYRDEILRLIVFYWKVDSTNYEKYKKHPLLEEEIYDLMIMLKEKNDEKFKETFSLYLIKMMHQHNENYRSHVQNDANILLTLALRYDLKRAMETIVTCEYIEVNKIRIIESKSVCNYENENFLLKLKHKNGCKVHAFNSLSNDFEVFEDNLDEQIIEEDQDNIIIDYDLYTNCYRSSFFSCCNILNNRSMKNNMTHPVLSTIINLKALQFHRLNVSNFWIFIAIHMLPFYVLLSFANQMNTFWFWLIYFFCILGTCFLIIRESIEFIISETAEYFKKRSNYIEIVLIVLSVLVLMLIPQGSDSNIMMYSSALLVLLATVEVLTFLPYPSMAIYMFMFKNVAITFWKFLLIFFLIIFAFAFSFCIVMKPIAVNNMLSNSTVNISKFNDEGQITNNFENIHTSLLKTLQMMSGEFTLEPFNLDNFQKILFCCFVITSLILFNLIIGLVISDIRDVKEQADFLFLKNQVENTLQTQVAMKKLLYHALRYWSHKVPIVLAILRISIDNYMFLKDIQQLCVNKSTKEVFGIMHKTKFPILKKKSTSSCKVYKLERETVEKLIDIVTKNKSKKNQGKASSEIFKFRTGLITNSIECVIKELENKSNLQYEFDEPCAFELL